MKSVQFLVVCILSGCSATVASAQDVQSLLVRIKAVGKEGAGNVEAAKAWKELVAKGPTVLPDVLAGMDDANPIAVNWLRGAVEAIHDKAKQSKKPIPIAKLDAFLRDKRHSGKARRLAYECLVREDPKAPERLLPNLLNDPATELRRDAVEAKLKHGLRAAFASADERKSYFKSLLVHARDRDQVNKIAEQLAKHGVIVDLPRHYGFLTRWLLIGPFDNVKGVGFNNVYPPEKGFAIKAEYAGKAGAQVRWKHHDATKAIGFKYKKPDEYGLVDIAEAVGPLKGAVVYAYAAVDSKTERPVEIRAGSNNAVRIYLNGKEVYFREEYHHGFQMDQHVGKGVLKAGRNEIMIKVCQNEQTDSWAQLWSFQLRVCDALGGAAPLTNVTPKIN